jgi:hypothetical protein
MTIEGTTLTLGPRGLGKLMLTDFEVDLRQVSVAFPLRGDILTCGVGLTLADGITVYFWTLTLEQVILAELASRGVPVDPQPRSASDIWGFRRGSTSTVATVPRWRLQRWAPLVLVIGTACLIPVWMALASPLLRVWLALVWVVAIGFGIFDWRQGRRSRPPQG